MNSRTSCRSTVNMDVRSTFLPLALSNSWLQNKAGSCMILDAMLLNTRRMFKNVNPNLRFVIFPDMRMPSSNTIMLQHKLHPSGMMSLMGIINYAVIQFTNKMQTKGKLFIRLIMFSRMTPQNQWFWLWAIFLYHSRRLSFPHWGKTYGKTEYLGHVYYQYTN